MSAMPVQHTAIARRRVGFRLPPPVAAALRDGRVCAAALAVAVAIYAVVFLRLTFRLCDTYSIMAYDIGIFDQAAWLISRGQTPFVTVRGLHLLADHCSLVVYLLAPAYWVWPSPKTLLLLQTLALALGAVPLYRIARERTGQPPVALLLAVAYLLYPAVHWTNAFEFHPEAFATPLLLQAFYLMGRRRWPAYFACLALALLTKENVGLTVAGLGVYAWFQGHRRAGALTAALGIGGAVLALAVVRHFNGGRPSPFFALYSHLGDSPAGIVRGLVTRPGAAVEYLARDFNRAYVGDLLAPCLLVALLAPEVLALALPSLLANMLSNRPVMHSIAHQYSTLIIPFVFIACAVGIDRGQRWGSRRWMTALMAAYLGWAAIANAAKGPLPLWKGDITPGLTAAEAAGADRLVALIPPTASAAVQPAFIPHLAHRKEVYAFPNPFYKVTWGYGERALRQMEQLQFDPYSPAAMEAALAASDVEYIALSPKTTVWPLLPEMYFDAVVPVFQHPAYGVVAIDRNVVLLRRGADHRKGLGLLARRSGRPTRTAAEVDAAVRAWAAHVRLTI